MLCPRREFDLPLRRKNEPHGLYWGPPPAGEAALYPEGMRWDAAVDGGRCDAAVEGGSSCDMPVPGRCDMPVPGRCDMPVPGRWDPAAVGGLSAPLL